MWIKSGQDGPSIVSWLVGISDHVGAPFPRDALVAELRPGMTDGVSLSGFANMPVAGLHQAFGLRGRGECQLAKAIECEDWSYFR